MDLVDFTERVLQKLPDTAFQRFGDDRVNVLLPAIKHEVSRDGHVRADLRRLASIPAVGNQDMFFVQGADHPRT